MIFAAAAPARSITSYSGTPLAYRCCSAFRICSAVRMGAPDILLIRLRSNGGGEPITIIGACDVNQIISGKGELRLFSSIGRNHSASVRNNAKTAKARSEARRVGTEGVSTCSLGFVSDT